MKIVHTCIQCNKQYTRYYTNINPRLPKRPTCSVACKSEWQRVNLCGDNNPNYGNKWDDSQKQRLSRITSESMTPERRSEIGNQHRGKKLSDETIRKIHQDRTSESYSRPHTEESKKKIGIKSAEKFQDPEYLPKVRKVMEDRGHWVNLAEKENFVVYTDAADWVANMFEDLSEQEYGVVNEVGLFNTKSNQKGMCRDHMFSRKDGFENLVFPEILRHPSNCEFILHSANSSKRGNSSKDITTLFNDIKDYKGNWHEHQLALSLVKSYEEGSRWDIEQFIEGFYNV